MRAKRVVLLSNRSLLAAGVQRLLECVDSLELSTVATGDPGAIPKLRQLAPEVIVLDSGDPSLGEGAITRLLGQNPRVRVVALNLDRTGIEIYRMHHVVQTDLDGLLEAIQGRRRLARKGSRSKTTNAANGENGGGAMGT
jgi:DNA-binding NarL/FixJ family response regulator